MLESRTSFTLLLFIFVFAPAILNSVFKASSFAAGVVVSCCVSILIKVFFFDARYPDQWSRDKKKISLLFLVFCIYCIQQWIIDDGSFHIKALGTIPILYLMILGSYSASSWLLVPKANIQKFALKVINIVCIITFIAGLLGWHIVRLDVGSKPMLFFTEPSLFALFFTPMLLYYTIKQPNNTLKILYLLPFAVGILYIQSVTLTAGLILIFILTVHKKVALFLGTLIILTTTFLVDDWSYYTDRLTINLASQNLSSLVYVQGLQMIVESMLQTHGLGVGLQSTGIRFANVTATDIILKVNGHDSNITDGGFLAAKIIIEFGIFGILSVALLAFKSFKSMLWLVYKSKDALTPMLLFSHAVVAAFIINLFVRDVGYLTGSSLLLFTSILIINRYKN